MFRLVEFELVHWDYWQRVVVPLDASIVTIVGPNGSGKTTLLDALRTLFALECSKKRDYKRYVRRSDEEFALLRGLIDNERTPSGRHPFFPLLTDQVTIACRIERKGGDWARQYCICEGAQSLEEIAASGVWMGVQEFRRRLLDAGLSGAIAEVLSLEQGQTDKLCELNARALLDLVFQVFGDKQVVERYQEARQHQEATARELAGVGVEIEKLALRIEQLTIQVNRLNEWRAAVRYTWRNEVGITFSPFSITGSRNFNLYDGNGRPHSNGVLGQIDFTPWGNGKSPFGPRFNARVGVQYTLYGKFNGRHHNYDGEGANATDNNALRVFTWIAF